MTKPSANRLPELEEEISGIFSSLGSGTSAIAALEQLRSLAEADPAAVSSILVDDQSSCISILCSLLRADHEETQAAVLVLITTVLFNCGIQPRGADSLTATHRDPSERGAWCQPSSAGTEGYTLHSQRCSPGL